MDEIEMNVMRYENLADRIDNIEQLVIEISNNLTVI